MVPPASRDRVVTLVVAPSATSLRRDLGPAAWIVLEELARRSTMVDGGAVTHTSSRSLAGVLGLTKDTVARALARLRTAGLVIGEQRRSAAGLFDVGTYRITVDELLTTIAPSARPARQLVPRSDDQQLALAIDS